MTVTPSSHSAALEVRRLDVVFGHGSGSQHVLHEVDLAVPTGQTVGLVGESGSGKSTLARAAVGMIKPTHGTVLLDGTDVSTVRRAERTALRRRIQLIPQDPYASLNPRMTIGQTLAEALDPRRAQVGRHEQQIAEALGHVTLDADAAAKYPHAFSGGQRQRIAIARALVVKPDIIIADEITSALDCSVQAEVLGVLRRLRTEMALTMMFISHDLAVVRHVSDEVAVMYQGRIVERAGRDRLFAEPEHDYTRVLLASVPDGGPLRPPPDMDVASFGRITV